MSGKETGRHFKRILSHTSSTSTATPASHRTDFQAVKKHAKLRTTSTDADYARHGNNYVLCPDSEPLLSHVLSSSPADTPGNDPAPQNTSPRGLASSLDFRQVCPRGIMSVTDIELTMGDEDHQRPYCLPPGSPMEDNSSTSTKSSNLCFPLKRCTKVVCDENSCLWHRCVLKLPQHVRWEDRIVTIELQRSPGQSFGFNYKSKQHVGKEEMYTLVTHVEENSQAARSGLAVGDLILSANNVPMQTIQKLTEINFRTQTKLKLLVQHPLEISSKASSQVEQLMTSMMNMNELQMTSPPMRLVQPPTPSTSPIATNLSPTKENIPLFTISKPQIKNKMQCYKLPQVRIFVMGNATNDFIRCLIGDSIHVFHDDKARCFEISMKRTSDGSVSIGNSESFSYLFENASESCINLELVSVCDDSFFHHCCSWMFTPNSIFILTFDTTRLSLACQTEMFRLCSLVQTVHTKLPGSVSNIRLYGIMSTDDIFCPEEVQTLFYTSLGNSLPGPKVIPITSGALSEEMKGIRQDIFNMVSNTCERQQVIYPTAAALDMLVSHRKLTTTVDELAKTLEEWNLDSKQVGPESLFRVIEDLRNTGNLIVTGSLNSSCTSENVKEFVLPCVLFDHLSNLAQCSEKDRVSVKQQNVWIALYGCGIVTRTEFLDVLCMCTSSPEKLLCCMEDLHLVFPVRVQGQDSGFGDIDSVLFPYFLQDIPFDGMQADVDEVFILVEFSEDVPVACFFSMLSELSQTNSCHSLTMKAQFVCHMTLQGEDVCLYFVKMKSQIKIFRNRLSHSAHTQKTIPQLVAQAIRQQIPSSVKVSVKALPEEKTVTMDTTQNPPVPENASSQGEMPAVEETDAVPEAEPAGGDPDIIEGASPSDWQLPSRRLPTELIVGRDDGAAAFLPADGDAGGHEMSEEERTTQRVLSMNMNELRYIHRPLHQLCAYLSIPPALEQLAGECGLSLCQWELYGVMIRQSKRLPAQVFLEEFFKEKHVTLRQFLQILLRMEEVQQHRRLGGMVTDLWLAALNGNSNLN